MSQQRGERKRERIKKKGGMGKVIGARAEKEIGTKEEKGTAAKDEVKEMEQKEEVNRERLKAKAKEMARGKRA